MSVTLRTKDKDIDLGGTLEFLAFEQELAEVAQYGGKEYPAIMGIIDLNEEEVDDKWRAAASQEAQKALKLPGLSKHARWVLGELAKV